MKLGLFLKNQHIQYHTLFFLSRTRDWRREVLSARVRMARTETTRGPIPGPISKIECDVVYIICLKQNYS